MMKNQNYSLPELGWSHVFQSQIGIDETDHAVPARLVVVHRSVGEIIGTFGAMQVQYPPDQRAGEFAVGDWVLAERENQRIVRRLERKTVLQRKAAGTGRAMQLIAANIDTLFITTSCNADFNIARMERYLAMARQAGVMPVFVLTKSDLADDPHDYADQTRRMAPDALVETLDARNPEHVETLLPWCGIGQTVALVGSSGVGKSTLIRQLSGEELLTQGIREDDAKGRHTTTARGLFRLPAGGWLIDTPGMRELQLVDAADGIEAVFDDIMQLAQTCRFSDCVHVSEPGCGVLAAVASGELSDKRLQRWRKLLREDQLNSASVAERREQQRALGKFYKSAISESQVRKGR